MAFNHRVHLFNLGTQEGEKLSTILDICRIKEVLEDLQSDLIPDLPAELANADMLAIDSLKVINISEQEIDMQIELRPLYEYRHSFLNKEAFDKPRHFTLSIDIDYIGTFHNNSFKKSIFASGSSQFYDQTQVVCHHFE